jgi:2-(1,2-epoxy-1,2-dihydrophenyl)acetyl-CoA isomerase
MTSYQTIELEIDETKSIAYIYLNRPDQLNALNTQLASDFVLAMKEIEKNKSVRCILITGKGKGFCAGGDLVEFNKVPEPDNHLFNLASTFHEGIKILKFIDIPSIAAVNGACFGVGLSLACACDIRVCSDKARFSVAFTSVGLSPDSSMTFYLPKIVGLSIANEMALLNKTLDAEEAKIYKLVSEIYPIESFLDEAKKIAEKVSQGPTMAFGCTKKLFFRSYSNDLDTHLEHELKCIKKNAGTEDFKEGTSAFLKKRRPNFKGK